jgi:hypothetical protein
MIMLNLRKLRMDECHRITSAALSKRAHLVESSLYPSVASAAPCSVLARASWRERTVPGAAC